MAEYHVGAGLFGIYCGTLNKPLKDGSITWRNKTECTDEAICAVRDFLKTEADSKKLSRHGHEWTTKDGKVVRLVVEIGEVLKDAGVMRQLIEAQPTLAPPNEWVSRVQELDELYTKLHAVTGFTAEQLLEMFAAGYTLEKHDYSKSFEEMASLLEYEKEHANAYYEECGQWEAENTQLKEKLEALKQDRDAIEQDFRAFAKQWWEEDSGFPCRWCKFERQGGCEWKVKHPGEICAGRAFEWRGQRGDCPGCGEPLSQAPNEPLAIEQLREMDGQPVWVKCLKPNKYINPPVRWRILEKSIMGTFGVWDGESCLSERDYGTDWLAYRRPPEGEDA